ncbi:MAG: hypothetical protein IKK43_02440 [Clostridia bacterium]|nr:hypothetical protein [Clostridia bacterium]
MENAGELIQIIDNYYAICYQKEHNINKYLNSDTTLIYISEYLDANSEILKYVERVKNIVVISKKYKKVSKENLVFYRNANSKLKKELADKVVILLELNENYSNSRYIVKSLIELFDRMPELAEKFVDLETDKTLATIIKDNNSKQIGDILNAFKAIMIKDISKRNEFIYDTVCDYLDSKFKGCNVCDFKKDKCVANRAHAINNNIMGCCHSFGYAKFYEPLFIKNIKVCQYMQNRTCATKNISCKLFTCRLVKKQHPEFNFKIKRILLLDCFFTQKQQDVLQYNYFRTKEQILEKLQEKNKDMYLWYICNKKYRIQ